ncbi:deoxyguanosinetriphosphate triphosphohydrolase [Prolixibacter sp. NT017]|uniref:deoxyguanosinetriphosphate triphosphohydrolase n=1 Tax=Prolixibacter sp. NT017 TaxID=2652390 RepID=UPI00127DA855|nr:deoxyguanosinetriphosphate triphosphohydrolase [Prolixibacter sp. NT017]GET26976.1 dehydrogenase [Prolixibacter sp. NT017]
MMQWNQLLSAKRLGLEERHTNEIHDARSQFQRDYDRIIFSSPFRRLQDKTQVFPLPGSIFVHNRLTHSLEVASVGRSLGNMVATELEKRPDIDHKELLPEIGSIVSSACLAHDLGNPPFGHSGESAIANYFTDGQGINYREEMTSEEWNDLTLFEGNANAFRILSHQFKGRRAGGFALTYTTLASIIKYPYPSHMARGKQKFGFFQSEKETFQKIIGELGLPESQDTPGKYARHPLVYLVEAADDICYQVMDVEDAHKLKILTYEETEDLLMAFFSSEEDKKTRESIQRNFKTVTDRNERIAYLRATVIGRLVRECATIFMENHDTILAGNFEGSLFKRLTGTSAKAMDHIKKVSVSRIYSERSVVQIEIAGYKILGTLMDEFTQAIMHEKNPLSKKLLSIIPEQYRNDEHSTYGKIQSVVDFVSGMTDPFALDLYRKITGISLPQIG